MQFVSWAGKRYGLSLLGFAVLAGLTEFLFIDLCGMVFQCGCVNWLLGGMSQCNMTVPSLRHCPLCRMSPTAYHALVLLLIAVQGVFVWKGRWAEAVLVFPFGGGLALLVLGWYFGYWG